MILDSSLHKLSRPSQYQLDLLINATGYEERSSSLVKLGCVEARHFVSLLFEENKVLDFKHNLATMQGVSAKFVADPLDFFRNKFRLFANGLVEASGKKLRIGVDVSSMNRTMAATTLSSIFAYHNLVESLELFYVPAKFRPPKLTFSRIEQIGAVTPELSGFDSEQALPVALVLGLGYEYGTAVGLINQLEPQLTICLRAIGHDPRFEAAVRRANLQFDFSTYNVEISEYDLLDVRSAYRHIENIIYTLVGNFRVVMVPMGPKIFAALLVLIALKYFGKIAVWRVARPSEPSKVSPDGEYIAASVDITRPSEGLSFDRLKNMIEGRNLEFLTA
jgi:hypothetical protein